MAYPQRIAVAGPETGRPHQDDKSNLTRSQYLIWLGQKLNPYAPLYNMVHTFTLTGPIDPGKFQQAFQTLIDRSDVLRTVIEEIDETPRQRVLAALPYEMACLDFSADPDPPASLRLWLDLRRLRRLDLAACLFDAALLKMGPACYVWYLNQHHLITDVLSFALTYRHMAAFYRLALEDRLAEAPHLPPYQEYVAYERTPPPPKQAEKAAAYWTKKLAVPFEPTDFYGRALTEGRPGTRRIPCDLGPVRSERLRAVARQKGILTLTPDMALLNIFTALLAALIRRVGGKRRISLGVPFHNRPRPIFKETMGLFITVLPLRLDLDPDETFRSLIQKCRRETLTTLRYAPPPLNSAAGKAYDVVLNYLTASFADFNGLPARNDWLHPGYGDSNHALRLQVHDFEADGNFMLYFDMNCAVFDETHRSRIIHHFLRLLDSFLNNPDHLIGQVDMLSALEKRQYLLDFNQTATPYPAAQTVVQLFAAQVDRTPDAVALQNETAGLTYADLNRRANQLAHYLRAQGVGPDRPVALGLDRSFEAVIGMLGVLKAGGAYTPLDPAYPKDRLAFMLADTQAPVLLTRRPLLKNLPGHQAHTLCLDTDWSRMAALPETNPAGGASPQNLAYIIYTSGSTGRPKGAMIEHRSLVNYVCWAAAHYTSGAALTFPLFTSLSFDLTATSIYVPLISGGRILIYDEEDQPVVLKIIAQDLVDVIKLTPAHLALVKAMNVQPSRLKCMIVGGEDFKRELALSIHRQFDGRLAIYNEYGPTEAAVGCMIHRFDPDRDTAPSVPLGGPIANARIYVLDEQSRPVPTGVAGELCIAGPGVGRGYLNRPDLTGQRFLTNPFSDPADEAGRLYKTGDLARWTGPGRLEFLGRADHQVKIKGVRIELGEIEAALLAHEAIQEAVVAVVDRQTGPDRPAEVRRCRRCGLPATYPGLTVEETAALLKDVSAAYNTQINDLLLTALAQATAAWTGRQSLLINLEGHGREEILEAVDLSRTVGWFTSLFPVKLSLPAGDDPGQALKAVKEQLRRIPGRGIGYGLLRYLSQAEAGRRLAAQPEAPVLFNYLGQFDRVLPDSELFRLNHPLIGARDPQSRRRHLLDINTFVINGRLQMDWTYSQNIHRPETIRRLADAFAGALRALIAHCLSPEAGGFTPSDFPLAGLTQAQLDQILAEDPRIEDIYPLSSLQQGMLFHTLYAPQSGMCLLQFSGLLPPDIDLAAFERAWREAVRRHAVLRTRFVWPGLAQPLQVVHAAASLPFEILDWRDLSPQEQETRLQRLGQDRWPDFDPAGLPLMQIILVRLNERQYRFIWNFHHLLFDRWSMALLLQDVFALYEAIHRQQPFPPRPTPRYRDYIAWIAAQDLSRAEAFWRTRLKGFTRPTPLLNDRRPAAPPGEDADYGREIFALSPEDTAELKRLARGRRLTVNTFIQGGWGLLLSYWSGQTDVLFGSLTPGRPAALPGSETMVGLFINTLPARVRIEPEAGLLDWLQDHQQDQVTMRRFDYTPLVLIQSWSEVPGGRPLFESLIGVQSSTPAKPSLLALAETFGMRDFDLVDWNSLPLSLAVEVEDQVTVVLKYARHRFDEATGRQMARHFKQLLEAMIRRPTATLQTLLAAPAGADQARPTVRRKSRAQSLKQIKRKSITLQENEP